MMAGRSSNNEPKSQDKDESKSSNPIGSFERWQLGLVAALIPTVFIALSAFIWGINVRVVTLEGQVKTTITGTQDRYTKGDAIEDHAREDVAIHGLQEEINDLSAKVHQLLGLHEVHKPHGK